MKKKIEDLKAQSSIIDREKAQQIEELKKTITTNKILNDDNVKLLQIIKGYQKVFVEQIRERMVILSKLYHLKNQTKYSILLYDALTTLQHLALNAQRAKIKEMQSWLRVSTKKDLTTITPRPKQTLPRRIKQFYDLKDLEFTMDLGKGRLKVEISFVNRFFNFLIHLKSPKL